MSGPAEPCVVGDVGGTSVRLAWIERPGAEPEHEWRGEAGAGGDLGDDLDAYLARLRAAGAARPVDAAFGIAGPVRGDRVVLTNRDGAFSRAALRARFGFARLILLNDYEALGHGLAALRPADVRVIGPAPLGVDTGVDARAEAHADDYAEGHAGAERPRVLIGPGTGLGVSARIAGPSGTAVVGGEGGHVTLASGDALEDAVVARLRARFGRASAERALSGEGLENLHAALCDIEGEPATARSAADITRAARAGDARCGRVLDLFFSLLGGMAGDLALTFGAEGGVFVGGGIVPRLGDAIDRSRFRAAFEAKGRHAAAMRRIPTALLLDAAGLALRGASVALQTDTRR